MRVDGFTYPACLAYVCGSGHLGVQMRACMYEEGLSGLGSRATTGTLRVKEIEGLGSGTTTLTKKNDKDGQRWKLKAVDAKFGRVQHTLNPQPSQPTSHLATCPALSL